MTGVQTCALPILVNIQEARDRLITELASYARVKQVQVIVVFDAQLVPGRATRLEQSGVQVVFTEENETADSYIERGVGAYIHPLNRVTVATSDMAE